LLAAGDWGTLYRMQPDLAQAYANLPELWTLRGLEPLAARLMRQAKRLPIEVRARVEETVGAARVAASRFDAEGGHAERAAAFEASRAVERLAYEVQSVPLPTTGWQRSGYILSVRILDTVRIRFHVSDALVDKVWARTDAFCRETERRCDWFWERCSPEPAKGGVVAPPVKAVEEWDVYELVRERLEE
jgi:hypothetical protein